MILFKTLMVSYYIWRIDWTQIVYDAAENTIELYQAKSKKAEDFGEATVGELRAIFPLIWKARK